MKLWNLAAALAAGCLVSAALPALAAAPADRYAVSADTVLDRETGLTWQRATAPGTHTWANAKSYCTGLTLAGGGWRLPDVRELQTLVDTRAYNPSIDTTTFSGTQSSGYWSSSPFVFYGPLAWVVLFAYGQTVNRAQVDTYSVRCVR
jgi:hypothetical protein